MVHHCIYIDKFTELMLGGVSTKIGMSTSVHALHVSCILDFEIRFSVLQFCRLQG